MSGSSDLDAPGTDPFDVASAAARAIAERTGVAHHDVAVVLGSGWAGASEQVGRTVGEVDLGELPGFAPAVPGQVGTARSVAYDDVHGAGRHALVIGARTHLYQLAPGSVRGVAHPVRTAAATGATTVVLTNGCGGIDPAQRPGTPVLIADHINLTGASPLEGPAFLDLSDLYSPRLRAMARRIDPTLAEGVYAAFRGPQYETPAEVEMARRAGATLVGMSTALEAIAARHAGMEVLGLALVTAPAAGVGAGGLAHGDVLAAGADAAPRLAGLLARIIHELPADPEPAT